VVVVVVRRFGGGGGGGKGVLGVCAVHLVGRTSVGDPLLFGFGALSGLAEGGMGGRVVDGRTKGIGIVSVLVRPFWCIGRGWWWWCAQ
jgi:hypothetical protein